MPEDPQNPVLALVKFGQEAHMESFLKEGILYFETLKYFRDLRDGGELRGDADEGLCEVSYGSTIDTLTITTKDGTIYDLTDPSSSGVKVESIQLRFEGAERLNVLCLYAVTPQTAYIDPRCLGFGSHCVLIGNKREFLNRVYRAFKCDGTFQAIKPDMVRYVDEGVHSGEFAPFCKYKPYDYQSEMRIVLSPGSGKPFTLRIGSIEDIATISLTKDLNTDLSIGYNLLPPKP
jgi:hypothetical protein